MTPNKNAPFFAVCNRSPHSSFAPELRYFGTQRVTYAQYAHLFRSKKPCSEEKAKHGERLLPFFALLFFFCCLFSSADLSAADRDTLNAGAEGYSRGGCVHGSGNFSTTKRAVSFFDSVYVDGPVDAFISAGLKKQRVEVTGDHNLHTYLITEVRGKTLYLSQRGSVCPKKGLRITVFTDTINSIIAAGTSTVTVSGLKNSHLLVHVEGSADLYGAGETETLVVKAQGAADVNLGALKARLVTISAKGSSDAEVYASHTLDAKVEGAGDVTYFGNPTVITKRITGAGDMTKGKELTGTNRLPVK